MTTHIESGPKKITVEQAAFKKITLRLIPFLIFIYVISFIDRANISFAALEMNASLGFNAEVYGIAAGLFFIGYFFFEVPSNILLNKLGARIWIARIMVTWGVMVIAMGFIQNSTQMYIVRFLLGASEAGLFPGILLYLRNWFPVNQMGKITAMIMLGSALAFIVGSPLSAWLIDNVVSANFEGWRWMFFIEGAMAVVMAPMTYFYLTDSVYKASWLSAEEKRIVSLQIESAPEKSKNFSAAFKNPQVWFFSLVYFLFITSSLGLMYFMPEFIKSLSTTMTNFQVGILSAVPYVIGCFFMIFWGKHADRKNERYIHSIIPLIIFAFAYLLLANVGKVNVLGNIAILSLAISGMMMFNGPFWSLASSHMSSTVAVVGIAMVNSFGGLGGFFGPMIMGHLKNKFGSIMPGITVLMIVLLINIALLIALRIVHKKKSA